MSRPTFINSNVVYHDNSTEYNIDARGKDIDTIIRKCGAEETKTTNSEDIEPVQDEPIPADQLFKYIHVAVTNEKEREQIHKTICNIVLLPKMPQICDELYKLMKNHKVLCSINPDAMLKELRRLGLPSEDQEGFSNKNFQYYYKVPKPD